MKKTKEDKHQDRIAILVSAFMICLVIAGCVFIFKNEPTKEVDHDCNLPYTIQGGMMTLELDSSIIHLHLIMYNELVVTGERMYEEDLDFGSVSTVPEENSL